MISCPFCQAIHVINTIFCDECGQYLLEEDQLETDPLDLDETGWVGEAADSSTAMLSRRRDSDLLALRLNIGAKSRTVEIPLDKMIHIGRLDPAINVLPELDLTDDDVLEKCISRRHARIIKQGSLVAVEDLGSANGTFVNGKKLAPYLPEMINDGDILQFGKLLIDVRILEKERK